MDSGQRLSGLTPARRVIVALLALLALSTAATLVIRYGSPLWMLFRNPDRLQAMIRHWGPWAPLGFVACEIVQVIIPPVPGSVVGMIGGYLFGLVRGVLLAMSGILMGAALAFLIAKLVGRRILSLVMSQRLMDKFDAFAVRHGPLYIFLLLLVPNPVGDWIYYLAGLSILPLPVFLLLVLAARMPSNLVEVFAGTQLYRLGARGYHLVWWQWSIIAACVIALAIVYLFNRKRIEALSMRFVKFPS